MRTTLTILILGLGLTAGCSKKPKDGDNAPSGKEAPSGAAPTAAASGGDIDLSPGGAAWKGWHAKGDDAQVTDAGTGDGMINVTFKTFGFALTQGDLHIPDMKNGAKSAVEGSNGKVTFTTDKPDALDYVTERPNADGVPIKSYGFAMYVSASGKKIGCSAVLDDLDQVASAKAVCQSVHK